MKYVFFDIDGTIRGKSREITKRNKEAIRKLREMDIKLSYVQEEPLFRLHKIF